jgi:hypothetical protein
MTKRKRGTPRRRTLAKRQGGRADRQVAVVVNDPEGRLAKPISETPFALAPLAPVPSMTPAFVGTMRLEMWQINALRRPVGDGELEWRAAVHDGPPVIPYLSHNGYRDRLDAAFGLGGWGMVPMGMPVEKDKAVFVPYALVIDGVPRVYAWGEQALHKMTYGDALEGAKSNAIVRCGKELGIARELWDRKHVDALLEAKVPGAGRRRPSPSEGGTTPAKSAHDGMADEPISQAQRERFWAIAKACGRNKNTVRLWLKAVYQVEDTSEILRRDYQTIVNALEAPGPLPVQEG